MKGLVQKAGLQALCLLGAFQHGHLGPLPLGTLQEVGLGVWAVCELGVSYAESV